MIRNEWDLADLDIDAAKEEATPVFRVSGCGVSAIGPWCVSMEWIYKRIIEKGGVPEVARL